MRWLRATLVQDIALLLVAAGVLTGALVDLSRPTPPAPVLRIVWRPASPAESHQWEIDNLGDTMTATSHRRTP